ncbi:GntR family transcriptional regulator [Bacteroidia bacterium]|nr:GntR family transcriptional regulator [Bacteroidia bacterium]
MKAHQSIFIQIADLACDRILSGEYQPDERIPSVRELAAEMEVNPNTAMRSIERLQQHGIIYNKRGLGYFVSPEAKQKIHEMRHANFIGEVLPSVFKEMILLDVSFNELAEAYNNYMSNPFKKFKP